ncbi:MAG: hypothetical protein ABEJ35_01685 [Halobacteriaceae archaeon]
MTDDTEKRVSVSGPSHLERVDAAVLDATGATTIDGDVTVDEADLSGATEIGGALLAERLDASGSVEVDANATVETADLSGSTAIDGDLTAGEISTSGSLTVGQRLAVETLRSSGAIEATEIEGEELETSGSVVAESIAVKSLESRGRVESEELSGETMTLAGVVQADSVTADRFTLDLTGSSTGPSLRLSAADSRIEQVRADTVRVGSEDDGGFLDISLGSIGADGRLEAEVIEGETVEIADTTVEELYATEATLGKGVEVAHLYAQEWEASDDATVGEAHDVDREQGPGPK